MNEGARRRSCADSRAACRIGGLEETTQKMGDCPTKDEFWEQHKECTESVAYGVITSRRLEFNWGLPQSWGQSWEPSRADADSYRQGRRDCQDKSLLVPLNVGLRKLDEAKAARMARPVN